jgi:hypothetical protein
MRVVDAINLVMVGLDHLQMAYTAMCRGFRRLPGFAWWLQPREGQQQQQQQQQDTMQGGTAMASGKQALAALYMVLQHCLLHHSVIMPAAAAAEAAAGACMGAQQVISVPSVWALLLLLGFCT